MRSGRRLGVVAALLFGAVISATPAHAEVLIDGAPDAVHLEVHHATLRQVLDAMRTNFKLRYRSDDALDQQVSGTFDGPLRRVAARVLDGYDFAIKVTSDGVDVLVLRQSQRGPVVAALQSQKPARPRPMTAQDANRRPRGLLR
jgi:hypothetical protein